MHLWINTTVFFKEISQMCSQRLHLLAMLIHILNTIYFVLFGDRTSFQPFTLYFSLIICLIISEPWETWAFKHFALVPLLLVYDMIKAWVMSMWCACTESMLTLANYIATRPLLENHQLISCVAHFWEVCLHTETSFNLFSSCRGGFLCTDVPHIGVTSKVGQVQQPKQL